MTITPTDGHFIGFNPDTGAAALDDGSQPQLVYYSFGTPTLPILTGVAAGVTPTPTSKDFSNLQDGTNDAWADVFLDDVSVVEVPEPASLAVLGVGLFLFNSRKARICAQAP